MITITAIGFAGLLAWFAVAGSQFMSRRARIKRRLNAFANLLNTEAPEVEPVRDRNRAGVSESALVSLLDARFPLAGGMRSAMVAGIAGLVTAALLVPAFGFFGVGKLAIFVVAVLVGGVFGWNVGNVLENAKRNEFSDRFLIAVEDFQRMVRHGISSSQALQSVTSVAAEPVRTSLRNIVLETEFGVPVGLAMDREARRIRISELSMLAAVLSTQARTGGNLSESVANLAAMLRERVDNRSRMKAATAESRITLVILALVPFAGIGIQASTQPELIEVMLGEARHLLGIGILLIVAGLIIAWMMIRRAQR